MGSNRVGTLPAPVGRPPKITQVHRTREDGTRELIWQAVISRMATTSFVEVAAASVGIHKSTIYDWLQRGAHATQLAERVGKPVPKADQPYVDFADAAEKAAADLHLLQATLVQQIARGGLRLETVTERYDAEGKLIDRTVKAEVTPPDLKALTWTLEHAYPAYYSSRARVEVTGADGGPVQVEHSLDAMVEQVIGALERSRQTAIEAESTEALEPGELE